MQSTSRNTVSVVSCVLCVCCALCVYVVCVLLYAFVHVVLCVYVYDSACACFCVLLCVLCALFLLVLCDFVSFCTLACFCVLCALRAMPLRVMMRAFVCDGACFVLLCFCALCFCALCFCALCCGVWVFVSVCFWFWCVLECAGFFVSFFLTLH